MKKKRQMKTVKSYMWISLQLLVQVLSLAVNLHGIIIKRNVYKIHSPVKPDRWPVIFFVRRELIYSNFFNSPYVRIFVTSKTSNIWTIRDLICPHLKFSNVTSIILGITLTGIFNLQSLKLEFSVTVLKKLNQLQSVTN